MHPRRRARAVAWAAVGGFVGACVVGIPMTLNGMMRSGPSSLVGSDTLSAGWAIHLLVGLLLGLPFGFVFISMRYGRALVAGAAYGLVLGAILSWWSTSFFLSLLFWIVYGIVVGLTTAWGIRRTAGVVGRVRLALGRPN